MLHCFIRKCIIANFVMLMLAQVSYASSQNTTVVPSGIVSADQVVGKVLDSFGHPLAGVNISIRGKEGVVSTSNMLGTFIIDASTKSFLVFECPGYNVVEKHILKDRSLTVVMYETYLTKVNVEAVLYDTLSQEKRLGSISTVHTNQLTTTPGTLYLYALPGRLAGLYMQQTSGFRSSATTQNYNVDGFVGNIPISGTGVSSDNAEFAMRLRGQNPVTLIDGVQRDIYSLDPENIESISVLKDAMSTLLLGQRSSRGAISITTKRAEAGKPRISFTSQLGFQEPQGLQKPLSTYQYANLLNEARLNDGNTGLYYSADEVEKFKTGSDPYRYANVDWQNTILRDNAPLSRYNLNINGGTKTAKYSVSLNYTDQEGMFVNSDTNSYNTNSSLKRYLINADLSVDVTKNINVALQLFGRLQEGNQPGAGINTVVSDLLSTPNNAYPVTNPNKTWGGTSQRTYNLLSEVIGSGYIQDNSKDVMANIDLGYNLNDFVKGLSAKVKANLSIQSQNAISRVKRDLVYRLSEDYVKYTPYGSSNSQSNSFIPVSNSRYWFSQFQLRYDRQFGEHSLNAMLVADQRVVTLNYDLPGQTTNFSAKGSYNFKSKYFAEAAVNYSGYNRYMPGHQYGLFYAGGLGWELGKESFIKDNISWINQLKIRATYGKTGSGIDNSGYYIWRQTFSNDNDKAILGYMYPQGTSRSTGSGYREFDLANVNITWEKANKFDLGFDASLLNEKLMVTGDVYSDRYFDLLQTRGKSIALIGSTYSNENIGINRYQGAELSITYQNNYRDFNYFVTANFNLEQSKVLFNDEQYQPAKRLETTGKPVGMIFGYIADGFIQTKEEAGEAAFVAGYPLKPGDIKYKDLNSDGVIDDFDKAPIGSNKPLFYYGVTLGFNYKGFDFSTLLQGVENRTRYICNGDVDAGFRFGNNTFGQAYEQVLNRWTPETASTATYPRLTSNTNTNYSTSSFWMRSGDYFRLKNISLGYNLPYKIVHPIGLAGIKVFVSGQNIFTQAAYDLIDPEVAVNAYPLQRVLNVGINIRL